MLANTIQGFAFFVPMLWVPSAYHRIINDDKRRLTISGSHRSIRICPSSEFFNVIVGACTSQRYFFSPDISVLVFIS